MKPDVSIVIPAYEEQDRLCGSLEKIVSYLRSSSTRAEVIVVDDGSTDDTAASA
jgi:glycosyltransferase involved in cell wall biosynthesis